MKNRAKIVINFKTTKIMKTFRKIFPRRLRKQLKSNSIAISHRDFEICQLRKSLDYLTDCINQFKRIFSFFCWSFYYKTFKS